MLQSAEKPATSLSESLTQGNLENFFPFLKTKVAEKKGTKDKEERI